MSYNTSTSLARADADLRQAQRERNDLHWTRSEYRRLLELLPVGLLVGRGEWIEYNNFQAAALLGYTSPREMQAVPLFEHIAEPSREAIRVKFATLRAGKPIDPNFESATFLRADRSLLHVEVAVIPLHNDNGTRTQLVFRDMTDAHRVRVQLEEANTCLQALSSRLIDVQERERRSLALELHDEVGQLLTAIKIHAQSLRNRMVDEDLTQKCDVLLSVADRALQEVRDLSAMLRPPQLDQLGLAAAVNWQLDTVFGDDGPKVTLDTTELNSRPSSGVEMAAFRIIQESLTNIVRHANATAVLVEIRQEGDCLFVRIMDNGIGFAPAEKKARQSVGLASMLERAQIVGGRLEIVSTPSAGTQVIVRLPFKN